MVTLIRREGQWTRVWVDAVCRTIANRHMPLIVDMGGKPTLKQEVIFDPCTHAVLLTKDDETRDQWHRLVRAHDLSLIADLRSSHSGQKWEPPVVDASGILSGGLDGLSRHSQVRGPVFDALSDRVSAVFAASEADLARRHVAIAPWIQEGEPVFFVNFNTWPRTAPARFNKQDVARGLATLPKDAPLALYGRAPNDLIARVAHLGNVAWLFSAREGWLRLPRLKVGRVAGLVNAAKFSFIGSQAQK